MRMAVKNSGSVWLSPMGKGESHHSQPPVWYNDIMTL
jgi:hypothetical protein